MIIGLLFALLAVGCGDDDGIPKLPTGSYEVVRLPDPRGSASLIANPIGVAVDSGDRLWGVFTFESDRSFWRSLVVAGPSGVTHQMLVDALPNRHNSVVVDPDGVTWLADTRSGVWTVANGEETLRSEFLAEAVALAPDGTVWAVDESGALLHFLGDTVNSYFPPASIQQSLGERVRERPLAVTPDGVVWTALGAVGNSGLATFDQDTGEWATVEDMPLWHASTIAAGPDGHLWVVSTPRWGPGSLLANSEESDCRGSVHWHDGVFGLPDTWHCDNGVTWYDGTEWHIANDTLEAADSIAVTPNGVVGIAQKTILHLIDGTSHYRFRIPWNESYADNVNVEIAVTSDGRLVVGSTVGFIVVDIETLLGIDTSDNG